MTFRCFWGLPCIHLQILALDSCWKIHEQLWFLADFVPEANSLNEYCFFSERFTWSCASSKICIAMPGLKCPILTRFAPNPWCWSICYWLQRESNVSAGKSVINQICRECSDLDNRRRSQSFFNAPDILKGGTGSCELGYESQDGIPSKQSRSRRNPSIFIIFYPFFHHYDCTITK